MGRHSICRFAITTLVLAWISPAFAQVKPEEVSFDTADGVELQGHFYPAKNGGGRPTVIMLHSIFKDPNKGEWDSLAKKLAEEGEGFNVLRFDFRGHGKSTVLKDTEKFWTNATNAKYMPALAPKKPKKIDIKDFQTKTGYFPMLANDIMAARVYIDTLSDNNKTNASSIYLIGATDTASLGMLFLAAEWTRPKSMRPGTAAKYLPVTMFDRDSDGLKLWGDGTDEAGIDIAGCIWLSPQRPMTFPTDVMKKLVSNSPNKKLREKNPMLFIYGEQDTVSAPVARFFFNEMLVAKGSTGLSLPAVTFTHMLPIPKTKNVGIDLVNKDLETEKKIIEYLSTIEKDRKNIAPGKRNISSKPPLIVSTQYGFRD